MESFKEKQTVIGGKESIGGGKKVTGLREFPQGCFLDIGAQYRREKSEIKQGIKAESYFQ